MRWFAALLIYRLLLPWLFVAAFPGWFLKMWRRGGFGTRLGERLAIYQDAPDFEPCGAVHVHAVSVGEVLLGLRLIRAWLERDPDCRFVLATGTATGHAVARSAGLAAVRVTYAPLDFRSMVGRYLSRFEPARVVLVEGEVWPHLMLACGKRGIPVALVNARMSPRSARRYRRFAPWLRPVFSRLESVAIQHSDDAGIWRELGVQPARIQHTGSLKFDPSGGARPQSRPEFQAILDAFGPGRRVILAASTHPGEDAWIALAATRAAPDALIVLAPRHAERRGEVARELQTAGFQPLLRSAFSPDAFSNSKTGAAVLVIDSTGELRDWTAHADAVVIGKSFLAEGGQNPIEAVLAGKPVIFGPHMQNFEPLASQLAACGGAIRAHDENGLQQAIQRALDPPEAARLCAQASQWIACHDGATGRILDLLAVPGPPSK